MRAVISPPLLADYLALRAGAGLSPKTPAQGAGALAGSWAAVHATDAGGATVGMGRVIGDGGWYFHIADMAVLPSHQRRGLGDAILTALIAAITEAAPASPYITLLADAPGRRLYERHGFVPTAPRSIGMMLLSR
ncbi:MAG: GNAT family N-acetyltransferase [Deltaproteobacteria bacterium]|nr:GNAT family N-acetyltransferase [Deltaproteobacteria bacterium]